MRFLSQTQELTTDTNISINARYISNCIISYNISTERAQSIINHSYLHSKHMKHTKQTSAKIKTRKKKESESIIYKISHHHKYGLSQLLLMIL